MPRIKRGVKAHYRHKKILKLAKGYVGARSKIYRVSKQAVIKSHQYAYRDRRQKKRNFRSIWIIRINAYTRIHGMNYNSFINGLKKAKIYINRKILANLIMVDKTASLELIEKSKNALLI